MQLGQAACAAGFGLTVYESVGSTNDLAFVPHEGRVRDRHWHVAHSQTAGRGRNGRQWTSRPGNLYATVLLVDPAPTRHWPKLGFVAGVSLFEAVAAMGELEGLRLKWPNDLLIGTSKLAGILLEARTAESAAGAVAIGFGVNCRHHPEGTSYGATDLAEHGVPVGLGDILAALSDRLARNLAIFRRGEGFEDIRVAWAAASHQPGQPVVVRQGTGERNGLFAGIDGEGRMLIEENGRLNAIEAADVFMPAAGGV